MAVRGDLAGLRGGERGDARDGTAPRAGALGPTGAADRSPSRSRSVPFHEDFDPRPAFLARGASFPLRRPDGRPGGPRPLSRARPTRSRSGSETGPLPGPNGAPAPEGGEARRVRRRPGEGNGAGEGPLRVRSGHAPAFASERGGGAPFTRSTDMPVTVNSDLWREAREAGSRHGRDLPQLIGTPRTVLNLFLLSRAPKPRLPERLPPLDREKRRAGGRRRLGAAQPDASTWRTCSPTGTGPRRGPSTPRSGSASGRLSARGGRS